MTSDRIVALNILMRALDEPLKSYNRHLRKAWRTETDSPENLTAREDGDKALLEIGKVVRSWVAQHSDPDVSDLSSSEHCVRAEPAVVSAPMLPTDQVTPATFVLWLDASDGSIPTSDGVQWPDGWVTIRHRHYGHTTTHHSPEAACEAAHGTQGRIVWSAPADRGAVLLWAADHYAKLVDENEAYDREHGQLDQTARLQHGTVRDVVAGLRRLAADTPQQEPQCTCGGPSTSTTLPSGVTYEEHKRICAVMTTDGADAQQPDTGSGDEQADGPTWSDACPYCKHWCTTSEPGAHEATCPMKPAPEPPVHRGGNAENCPACQQLGFDMLSYPWECPGPEPAAEAGHVVADRLERGGSTGEAIPGPST